MSGPRKGFPCRCIFRFADSPSLSQSGFQQLLRPGRLQGSLYVYAIVVGATPERMREVAAQHPFEVLQQDTQAHIVRQGKTVGYALFERQEGLDMGALTSVDAPCLIMMREDSDQIVMSLCDPDLRLMKDPVPDAGYIRGEMWYYESEMQTIMARLRGQWDLCDTQEKVRVVSFEENETVLAFDCVDGLTIDVQLGRV